MIGLAESYCLILSSKLFLPDRIFKGLVRGCVTLIQPSISPDFAGLGRSMATNGVDCVGISPCHIRQAPKYSYFVLLFVKTFVSYFSSYYSIQFLLSEN
jgi:hypothetical protein